VTSAILIGFDCIEPGYFVDLILSTSESNDVRIKELYIVLQYGRAIPLWVNADKEHLDLRLFRETEAPIYVCQMSQGRRTDVWTTGKTETEQNQLAAQAAKRERLTVLIGKGKVRCSLGRDELDRIKGSRVFRLAETSETANGKSYAGNASKHGMWFPFHLFNLTNLTPVYPTDPPLRGKPGNPPLPIESY
jgi:hypothetical protein